MEAFKSSSLSPTSSALFSFRSGRRAEFARPQTHLTTIATTRGRSYSCKVGRRSIVDGDMAVLRKRIRDLKMVEEDDDEDHMARAPEGWMGWEKQYYYEGYNLHVLAVVAELQQVLVGTRPLVAFAFVALLLISVPTTGFILLTHLVNSLKMLFAFTG